MVCQYPDKMDHVVAHEVGHALSLEDSTGAIMNWTVSPQCLHVDWFTGEQTSVIRYKGVPIP